MRKRGWQGLIMDLFGAQDRVLEVTSVTQVTPLYRRVTFLSPQLLSEREYGPGAWLRLWLPAVDGSGREFQRAYTMIDVEPATGRFSIDFLLHSTDGPGSAWARSAAVGDRIAVQYYGGEAFRPPELEPAGWLLVADEASLPAANAIIGSLPEHMPIDLILYCEAQHLQQLPVVEHPQLQITRVPQDDGVGAVAAAVAAGDRADWYAWVVIEASDTKYLRQALTELGFPKASTHFQAYWVKGKEMGTTRAHTDEASAEPRRSRARLPAKRPRVRSSPSTGRGAPQQSPNAPQGVWRSAAGVRLLAPLRRFLTGVAAVQVVASLLELLPLLGLAYVAVLLVDGAAPTGLGRLVLTLALLGGLGTLLSSLVLGAGHFVDARFGAQLRSRMVNHLGTLPLGWLGRSSTGRVQQAVEGDSNRVHVLTTHAVPDLVAAAVPPAVILLALLVTHAGLALLLLLPVVVGYVAFARLYYTTIDDLKRSVRWAERIKTRAATFLAAIQVDRLFPTNAFEDMLTER